MMGYLWWTADSADEVAKWRAELQPKGVSFAVTPRAGERHIDVVIALPREQATEILGYTPDDADWLEQENGK